MNKTTLYNHLTEYSASDAYGFHMPGHKRNRELQEKLGEYLPFSIDITEIDGFDDLHHAQGIIKVAEEEAADLYGARETHFLVNGSTVGILSAILGTTKREDKILVARNCHKSVYHALELNALSPVYLYPQYDFAAQLNGEISAREVEKALEVHPDIRAVVIVSPTYDGVVSDIRAIANVAHERHIPLIVDEAHGAHFGFHPYFPERALDQGADVVINSLHKTLPALTQTALIHLNGSYIDRERIRKYLHMLQSSSPSYVLMASMDACIHFLQEEGDEFFSRYVEILRQTRKELAGLAHLKLVETAHYDPSKIVISVARADITSHELSERLRDEYHLEMEMTAGEYILAMTSVGDTSEGMKRLVDALFEIDKSVGMDATREYSVGMPERKLNLPPVDICCTPFQAGELSGEFLEWQQAVGGVSLEYAYLYPPGCPLLTPGERVSQEVVNMLQWYRSEGFDIEGPKKPEKLNVWTETK